MSMLTFYPIKKKNINAKVLKKMLVLHTQKHIKVIGYHEKVCSFSRDEWLVLVMGFTISIHMKRDAHDYLRRCRKSI